MSFFCSTYACLRPLRDVKLPNMHILKWHLMHNKHGRWCILNVCIFSCCYGGVWLGLLGYSIDGYCWSIICPSAFNWNFLCENSIFSRIMYFCGISIKVENNQIHIRAKVLIGDIGFKSRPLNIESNWIELNSWNCLFLFNKEESAYWTAATLKMQSILLRSNVKVWDSIYEN